MNGNALFHAVGLAFYTLVLLPLPLLVLTGRMPGRLRTRVADPRSLALALIGFWLLVLVNAVPRILDAGTGVVAACSVVAVLCGLGGVVFFFRAAWATARAARGR
ncbi:hypothetical protein M4914_01250 [Streptomyces somaliensis DSM 40738]|uniref:Uncharacterized protein n=1 Tax=Streptomyces somaliensis (strain ATCC 33201 / DSM 40738 / JCM 12659 / KCTC 9044 / NCTC 11332 / NRRL B-12077 / IP 733) TaxID=1134445 RepID=A0AA44DB47_STRE0|nr:hypothetical protein [Streptomyces somaliensis]MCQ0021730.1 hypothetical protein [Streptomyces somaliensis DSM 40738]NKY13046.1 hypothetical protein [Streptomyces somaliensis DSM 40738]